MPDIATVLNVLTAAGAVATAMIAWVGVKNWRQQLHGQTEYELARRLLRSVYRVRDAVLSARSPWIDAGEMVMALTASGADLDSIKSEEFSRHGTRAAYALRWNRIRDALSDMDADVLEAEVLWGQELRETLKPIDEITTSLYLAMRQEPRLSSELRPGVRDRELQDVLFGVTNETSPFTSRVEQAIRRAEAYLRPKLILR